MVADSSMTDNDRVWSVRKVFRSRGALVATAGDVLQGKAFRIGHLGDINDGTLIGALGITEMALELAGIPHKKGGVQAALDYIPSAHAGPKRAAAE